MKSTICALKAELEEFNNMLKYNHILVCLGAKSTKQNSINQQPTSLAADRFYAMSQEVIPKASPVAISHGCGLIAGDLLEIIGINDNNIIYFILNGIPILSILRSLVKKVCEAAFMRIA